MGNPSSDKEPSVLAPSTHAERVSQGLRAAKRRGQRLGRPRVLNPRTVEQAQALRAAGLSWAQIGRRLGISRTSARRACTSPPAPRQPAGEAADAAGPCDAAVPSHPDRDSRRAKCDNGVFGTG